MPLAESPWLFPGLAVAASIGFGLHAIGRAREAHRNERIQQLETMLTQRIEQQESRFDAKLEGLEAKIGVSLGGSVVKLETEMRGQKRADEIQLLGHQVRIAKAEEVAGESQIQVTAIHERQVMTLKLLDEVRQDVERLKYGKSATRKE